MSIFHTLLPWLESSKYVLLFLGAAFEGPAVMMTGGFLFRLGQFSFLPMYLALVLGDFTSDMTYYCVGRFGTRLFILRFRRFLGVTPEIIEKVESRFLKYHQKILIISKMTMGMGFATVTLMVAGMFRTPTKNFVLINLIGGFIWTGFVVGLGYYFGNIYSQISGPLKIIFVCAIVAVLAIIFTYVNKKLKEL